MSYKLTVTQKPPYRHAIGVNLARLFVEVALTRSFRESRINRAINATFAVLATRIGTGGEAAICMRGSTVL